jgi:hypothetical protein
MVYCGTNYRASLAIFTFFYLADAAAFSVGQYRGVFESGNRRFEWAVLIHWLLKSKDVARRMT